jgi:hypothetical protein
LGEDKEKEMAKFIVLKPFVNFSPSIRQYTHDDIFETDNLEEADRMIDAGILRPSREGATIETESKSAEVVEKAVKRGRKES